MNWNIVNLDRSLPDGVVSTIHWTLTETDGDFSGSVYGSVGLEAKDPADPSFVAFESLTKEQAIEWLKDALGEETVAAHEANVAAQIEAQKNPTKAAGVPWNNQPAE